MEESSVSATNLNLKVLKTQNKCLVARLNTLRSTLRSDAQEFDASKPSILNCVQMVDLLTNNLKRVFDSFKTAKDLTNLKTGDPVKEFTEKISDVISKIGANLKSALQTGTPVQCEAYLKDFKTSTLFAFQGLLSDRSKFLELASSQNPTIDMNWRLQIDQLAQEKLAQIVKIQDLESELAELKENNTNTTALALKLKTAQATISILQQRLELLADYDKKSVEQLLELAETSASYPCVCGADMLSMTHTFLQDKKREIAAYRPPASSSSQADVASGPLLQEKDEIIKELRLLNEKLTQKVSSLEVSKATLDLRLLESPALETLSKQLLEVISYSMSLKGSLETAEKTILSIQEKRLVEIKEIHARYSGEHLKLLAANQQLQMDNTRYKQRNTELQTLVDNLNQSQSQGSVGRLPGQEEPADKLLHENTKLKSELDQLYQKYREESKRTYKYKKELEKTREEVLNEMLNRYSQCDLISNRHKHFNDTFGKLLEFEKNHGLNLKNELEELSKYVQCREDKIKDLEKRWNKAEKESNDEKKKSQEFITMLAETNAEYEKVKEDKTRLENEYAQSVSNLSKVLKEKTTEKLKYDTDNAKLLNELKVCKERLQATIEKQELMMKNTQAKEKNSASNSTTFNNLKAQLDIVNEQLVKITLDLENRKKDLELKEGVLKATEGSSKKANKELSEYKTQLVEKDKLIENYFKKSNPDLKFDLSKLKADDFITARLEVDELRKKVMCEVCNKRHKNKIIAKCYHQFCGHCLDDCLDRRERKCPTCGEKFSHNDLKQVY